MLADAISTDAAIDALRNVSTFVGIRYTASVLHRLGSRLPLHTEPVRENAAIHAECTAQAGASVGILSVTRDAGFGCNHADLAMLSAGDPATAISVDVTPHSPRARRKAPRFPEYTFC
jgi:hypothetical protein